MDNFKIILIILFSIILIINYKDIFLSEDLEKKSESELYDNLRKNYSKIFLDNNRNAGGAQYFEYIVNKLKPTRYEFDMYNRFYCAVSGSLIDPKRKNIFDKIKIKNNSDEFICGDYYRCCIPCNCDIMRCARVEKLNIELKDGIFEYDVLTINDPCEKENLIPNEVSSFVCNNNKTQNGIHTDSGRLVVGVLFNTQKCSQQDIESIDSSEITGDFCRQRNSQNPEELRGGMGDIFVKLCSL